MTAGGAEVLGTEVQAVCSHTGSAHVRVSRSSFSNSEKGDGFREIVYVWEVYLLFQLINNLWLCTIGIVSSSEWQEVSGRPAAGKTNPWLVIPCIKVAALLPSFSKLFCIMFLLLFIFPFGHKLFYNNRQWREIWTRGKEAPEGSNRPEEIQGSLVANSQIPPRLADPLCCQMSQIN